MGKVIIQEHTTKNPITMIGEQAGICWGADISDKEKNYKRGIECLNNKHGRTFEFPDVYAIIDGYSARVVREWYTHIGGSPTRLQASTRYIDYKDFDYIIPKSIKEKAHAENIYKSMMNDIQMYLNDPFNIFGTSKEYVRTLYNNSDIKCALFQTGMNRREEKNRIYSKGSYSRLNTLEDRIKDRNERIQKLLNSLANTQPTQVAIANELLNGNITKLRYMNPRQSDSYKIDNPVKLLLVLAETEGIYRKISQVNKIKEQERLDKEKKLEQMKTINASTNEKLKDAIKAIQESHNNITEYNDNIPILGDPRKSKLLY